MAPILSRPQCVNINNKNVTAHNPCAGHKAGLAILDQNVFCPGIPTTNESSTLEINPSIGLLVRNTRPPAVHIDPLKWSRKQISLVQNGDVI